MNGILLIDKPKEYTSHDIVAIIKKITGEKVGHTGTLDPNATGVLPLLIGDATKISKYLVNHDKTYIATIKLGIKTDTADGEGKILEEKDVSKIEITEEKIKSVLKQIIGKQKQIPPIYSAIKVNGKKLYEYARIGKNIEVKARDIEIYNTKLLEFDKDEHEIIFEVSCSKGTYIRTVCEDVSNKLGTVGYMKELRRIKVGDFDIESANKIEEIKNNPDMIKNEIITIENFFTNKEKIYLSDKELNLFLNGVKILKEENEDMYRIYSNNEFIGLGIIKNCRLKRDVII